MADKIAFNMSDKSLLTKLHEAAMKRAKLDNNKPNQTYILLNTGISYSAGIVPFKKNLSAEASKNSDKIPFFSNKAGIYEAGIYVKEAELQKQKVSKFTASSSVEPVELYKQLAAEPGNSTKLDIIKEQAYNYLSDYMAAFCGEKYAKSIGKDMLKSYAFEDFKQIEKTNDYELGECSKKIKNANVLLYKIGFSIGAKK